MHMDFLGQPPAFLPVARRAGGDQVAPDVRAAAVTRQDMIDRQMHRLPAAILAGVIVPPENFPLREVRVGARRMDHFLKLDDRRDRVRQPDGVDRSASVGHQPGLAPDDQMQSPPRIAHVDRLKICV